MSQVTFVLNGERVDLGLTPAGTLLDWLRDERGLTGTKNGCGVGQCGACTVLIDGMVATACVTKLASLDGKTVETIEALSSGAILHPIQQAFIDEGAIQCGFCTPGMVMAVKALFTTHPHPTEEQIREAINPNLCRCTGYTSIIRAVQRAAGMPVRQPTGTIIENAESAEREATIARKSDQTMGADTIGGSPPRKHAWAKVTGAPVFAADLNESGQLYGALYLSETDHARIVSVDTTAAAAMPGVVKVFTAADIPGRNGFGLMLPHQPVLAGDEIRYRGEPVAFVVAESESAARKAARKITVDIQELPVLHDPEESLAESAPVLHEGGNIAHTVRFRRGDVKTAFADAHLVVEGEYETAAIEHAYLEPEACLAVPGDIENNAGPAVTVYTANQGSGAFQEMIAASLAIERDRVRVVHTPAGGGFGGKEEPTVQIHAALAAVATGRPVKVVLDRTSSIKVSTKRHPARMRMRHAVDRDGRILGVEADVICDAGAYLSLTRPVVFRTVVMAGGPYEIPNVRLESHGIYTNTNPSGAFRGFGSTQIAFASELQMDKIADQLGIDPIALRRINGLDEGKTTPMGHRLGSGQGYLATVDRVEEALKRARAEIEPSPGKRLGFGVASAYKNVGIGNGLTDAASAAIEVFDDESFTVYVGVAEIGQGSDTVMAQIAAATLDVPYDTVSVVTGDTARCPDAGMTTASRQTYISGNAVQTAAATLKARIDGAGGVKPFLDATVAEEQRDKRRVEERYTPPSTMELPEVYEQIEPRADAGLPVHFAYCYTTMAAVIEIAPDGSGLKVRKLITAQDVGTAINLSNVYGQVEGAAVMGYGFAVRERFENGRSGRQTLTLDSLKPPRSLDSPEIECYVVEDPTPEGPFGAKGLGEIPLNPAAPAISAAIHDAIGRYVERLPIDLHLK